MILFEQLASGATDRANMDINSIKTWTLIVWAAALFAGCSDKVNQCNVDSDCKDIAYPFCDEAGTYPASGGETHVCTIVPTDCPVDRCGCAPGATTCDGDQLSVCNTDGTSVTATSCALGCAPSNDRCYSFEPSNGLGAAMLAAEAELDVALPSPVTINSDSGEVRDAANALVTVNSLSTADGVRVFIGKSFVVGNARIVGSDPVAFVAPGTIEFRGDVADNASGQTGAAGSLTSGACVGQAASIPGPEYVSGGGGNGTAGGRGSQTGGVGGDVSAPGGALVSAFTPLLGGCQAGGPTGGGGGGAMQVVSLTSVSIMSGTINLGGAGGMTPFGGGGSGGTLVLEAPKVSIDGAVTANGGAGAGCNLPGPDGGTTTAAATAPTCTHFVHGGDGGSVIAPAGGGAGATPGGGGGGGAVGRLKVVTADGAYTKGSSSIVSAVETVESLILK